MEFNPFITPICIPIHGFIFMAEEFHFHLRELKLKITCLDRLIRDPKIRALTLIEIYIKSKDQLLVLANMIADMEESVQAKANVLIVRIYKERG